MSAGLLLHRRREGRVEALLVHPGGPMWRRRWQGWWQVPKGAIEPGETPIEAARREFREELGQAIDAPAKPLGEITQKAGKRVIAFACEADFDPVGLTGATVTSQWPRGSGRLITFPEVDAARWFALDAAARAILPSQTPFLVRLAAIVTGTFGE